MERKSYPRWQVGSVEVGEPDDQDRRIGKLKDQLRALLGQEEFTKFYVTTAMDSDLLERQLFEKVEALNNAMSSCDHSFYALSAKYGDPL